jgi:asparagine synthase (glutamine-hydrolysing)
MGTRAPKASEPDLKAMAETLTHRGPDTDGYYTNEYSGLGFRRLSIIDLATGNQPIFNEDGTIAVICNGEIFNYRELRSHLEACGHRFSTRSDVEVLVHLYEKYGFNFLNMLNGQFAFAIVDEPHRQLFLARDHVGIAPLHYTVAHGEFVFASEIKAILRHPGVERRVDLTGLDQVLTFPGLVSPRTMFADIHRVPPGHYLVVNAEGIQSREYWDLNYPLLNDAAAELTERQYVDELTAYFEQSIRYRLHADVPVGFYLSGGLDSSLTAAFIRKLEPQRRRHAFSITFEHSRADEGKYQRLMADRVDCELHTTDFDWNRTADMIWPMIYHAECPVKETYNTCSMALSRAARTEGIKVILTGEGADELFAGYVGYRFDWARIERARTAVMSHSDLLEERMRETLWGDRNIFYEHSYYAQREERRALYSGYLQQIFSSFDCLTQPLVNKERLHGRHPVHQRSYLDFKLRMSDHLLMDHGDAMALANSVEARYPLLDIDLVDYARTIPPHLKLHGYTEKYLLRKIGAPLLPKEIITREKFGWFAPGSAEMLQAGVEWIHDILSTQTIRRQGYFDPNVVETLKQRYCQPGFRLNQPYETDWLIIIATFGVLKDVFELPDLN